MFSRFRMARCPSVIQKQLICLYLAILILLVDTQPTGFHQEPSRMLVKLLTKESQAWNYMYSLGEATTAVSSDPCSVEGESCEKYCQRVWKSSVHYCRYCSLAKAEVCRCF